MTHYLHVQKTLTIVYFFGGAFFGGGFLPPVLAVDLVFVSW